MPLSGDRNTDRCTIRMSFALMIALLALVAAGKAVLYDSLDPDAFLHLLAAKQLLRDGIGPIIDSQSFASIRTPWTPYSWLAELGMLWVWTSGGFRAAVATHALMSGLIVAMVALACRESDCDMPDRSTRRSPLAVVVAVAFAAFWTLPYLSFRPVTLALFIMAVICWLLRRDRRLGERSAAVWVVIPLTVLLVNVHLYAIIVPLWQFALVAGAAWERWQRGAEPDARRRLVRYAALCIATGLACLATPMLPGFVRSILFYQFADAMVAGPVVAEYQPIYRGGAGTIAAALVALVFILAWKHRDRLRAGEWCWLLGSAALLFRMGRFSPVFALAAAPILAGALPKWSGRAFAKPALAIGLALLVVMGAVRIALAFPRPGMPMSQWVNRHGPGTLGYPCAAADYVASNVPPATGRLLNEYTWGGYLSWRFADSRQVLLDGRTNLYTPDFWRTIYFSDVAGRNRYLSTLKADAAILPADAGLLSEPLSQLSWRVCYKDDRSQVLVPPSDTARLDRD